MDVLPYDYLEPFLQITIDTAVTGNRNVQRRNSGRTESERSRSQKSDEYRYEEVPNRKMQHLVLDGRCVVSVTPHLASAAYQRMQIN
jgi:hypothetical protein